jgi:hypothetical protein
MPMNFPDMKSLKMAAKVHKFRQPMEDEPEIEYRRLLAEHVRPIDLIESEEIRNGVGWDRWNDAENRGMLARSALGRGKS